MNAWIDRKITFGVCFVLLIVCLRWPYEVIGLCIAFSIARSLYWAHRRAQAARPAPPLEGALVGHDDRRRPVVLTDAQLAAHGLLVGATGSGKTTSLLTILERQIARGHPVVMIDLKGSPQVAIKLKAAAHAAGRPFRLWTPDGPASWNPLALGNPTELKDKLISTTIWSEPHYQLAAERYLQRVLQVIHSTSHQAPTLAQVVALCEPKRLAAAAGQLDGSAGLDVREYLTGLTPDQRSAITGLASRLAVISESHTGAYLTPNGQTLDLHQAINNREVVLFSLNSSRYGKLAGHLASLCIQDLTVIAGHRLSEQGPHAYVAIDEFSALHADNLLNLLARARDSHITVLLATQEMTDLDRLAQGFRDQVLGIIGLTIAHRQSVPASAELLAKMIGTHTIWQHTYQTGPPNILGNLLRSSIGTQPSEWSATGLGTAKQVEEFRIHPNILKDLPTGRAVFIHKIPTAQARLVNVQAPDNHDH